MLCVCVCWVGGGGGGGGGGGRWCVNNEDPDQMPHSFESDLGLYCLLRYVCLNT